VLQGVIEAYIGRIEFVNPRLNALVVPLFERARHEAAAADVARDRGMPLGLLYGVPFTVKFSSVRRLGRINRQHLLVGPTNSRTSTVCSIKVCGPHNVVMGTSAASRPTAIGTNAGRGE